MSKPSNSDLAKFYDALELRDHENDFDHRGVLELYKTALREKDEIKAKLEESEQDCVTAINYNIELHSKSTKLVEALKKVKIYYFIKSEKPGIACWACDMGDSGYSNRPDGHDDTCAVALIHDALVGYDSAGNSKETENSERPAEHVADKDYPTCTCDEENVKLYGQHYLGCPATASSSELKIFWVPDGYLFKNKFECQKAFIERPICVIKYLAKKSRGR